MEKPIATNMPISELNIQELKPFPLPKSISKLPTQFLDTLANSYELTRGYVKSLDTYEKKEQKLRKLIDYTVQLINGIIDLIGHYDHYSETIQSQIRELDILYKEFSALETNQYQLLSSNFNQNFLQVKYKKLLQHEDERAKVITEDFRKEPQNMGELLSKFRESRKMYHYRREKLNRWEEDRVSGFI